MTMELGQDASTRSAAEADRIDEARRRLASRYGQSYHQDAIMAGEWDRGSLFRAALAEVDDARASLKAA